MTCESDEYCGVQGGVHGCHPKGSSTCTAAGDPHYTSFDKRKFNFQGNCTYVLAKPCNSSLTPFTVYTANEHRNGVKTVSYVKAVHVSVYGITVSILRNRAVQVDGEPVTVPIRPLPGVTVKPSGKHVVLQADFGLTVRYDGRHYVDVKVPSDYSGQLCGLCGDYNGIPGDDFRTPEGQLVKGANDFGNSWNVDQNCTLTDSEVTPQCSEAERDTYEGPSYCGILLDHLGPFAACHYKIDPMAFFQDCVYDMCALNGNKQQLCEALESYVTQCQQRNITIGTWRNETFCPLQCPPNSHYQPCASACPATCLEPHPQLCDQPCAEGCQCDKGFVQSGDKCVPRNQCGCVYNGTYYRPGEVIWSEACNQVCKCLSSNNVQCTDTSCGPDEYCDNKGGVQGCFPKGSSTCTASGDPHYTSFDKRKFNFQGNCTYVFAKPCNSSLTPFTVYTANEHRNGVKTVSYVKAVYVSVYGITVSILRNRAVQMNGEPVTIPIHPIHGVTIKPSGRYVVLQTDFGLTVRYDGRHHVDVKITSDYSGQLCGLCGDYNGIPSDDFRTPEGQVVKGVNDFGNSWNVDQNCTLTDTEVTPECSEAERDTYEGPSYCGMLLDHLGPFAACHYKIDPMAFFQDCVYDMCALNGNKQQLCEALESYVTQCQQRNITIGTWRNETFCPLRCPPNSHYQPCASACPATCLEPRPQLCDQPCAEGCQCDKGFVQSGDKCVPRSQCGCVYNGTYYRPGEVIWSEACNQVCKCLSSNNIQCTDTSCAPDEYCDNKGGVQGCYPKGSSTCTASGDPHYTSFDKRKFNFQGNCTYVLAKPCNSSLTPFTVYTANEHRNGVKTVSYVKAVYVSVYGITVSILRNRAVQVNGEPVTIPIHPIHGVTIKPSGRYVVLQTDFGLTVRYDGRHHVDVKITSDYSGQLCGLCGDYNGIPSDDFRTPEGQVVKGVNDFGNSWNVDQNCTLTDTEVTPQCSEAERDTYEGPSYCGMLLDHLGPFAACHYKIDPMAFFQDCVYDMCALNGNKQQLCEALESYVTQCQQRNITIGTWRNETFCPLQCPPNSHYQPCASACPATCLEPRPQLCDQPCAEGCQCDKGFVQSGDKCVPRNQCGCVYNGTYYQPGEVIWSEACNQVCKCLSSNNVQCTDTSCGPDEYCDNKGGVQGCYPKGSSTCTASGDPHYTSFDKRKFNFQGNCTYVLAKPCNSSLTPFTVYTANEHRNGVKTVSYVKAVYVSVYGITVSILRNRAVQVNGEPVTIPIHPIHGVTIKPSGRYVVLQIDFGLTVRYDGRHHVDVKITSDYSGQLCGLCGDYNGIPSDDFRTPEGQVVKGVNDFGNSWNVDQNCTLTDTEVTPECSEAERDTYEGPSYCGILLDHLGPFAACHYKIDPMAFFQDCVYDMCALNGNKQQLCEALESYVTQCQQRNVTIGTWRNETFCPLRCPPNSHYQPCASACPATCLEPRPQLCDQPCAEGCQCDKGFVQSGDKCVPRNQCGCVYNGTYYQPGEVIWSEACNQVCKCLSSNNVQCTDTSCAPDEYCDNKGGVQGCYPKGSSTCTASGDPHYTSFDKRKFNFQGNCTYVLAKPCNSSLTPFTVYTANEHRNGVKTVSYVKAVYVSVYGITVSILRNRAVQVNGEPVTIPIHPIHGVTIKPSGRYVVLQTDFGLTVRYDGRHHVDVKVTSDYSGQLCGLCGDYNGIPSDDFRTPEGQVVKGVNDFGNSWNVDQNCTLTDTEVTPECSEAERDTYEGPSYCGILLDHLGPFAACHYKIDPMAFFQDCVYDMCALNGNKQQLCEALESYVTQCQQRNITIGTWRNETFCPLRCPPNSHYQPCASACPATCLEPRPQLCDQPCAEGCQCDKGFVQSGDKCVPRSQCGCVYNGTYYRPGDVIWSEACNQVCKCLSSNNIQCTDTSCAPDEYCDNKGGVQGCYPKGSSTCTASGDPHYTSFDKRKFNFQGNCTYVLAKPCNSSLTPFTVYTANEHRNGVKTVSYVKAVHVSVYGITVSILRNRAVQVNGEPVTIPIHPITGITIKPSGRYVVLQTDFGLTVRYDGRHHVDVKITSDYSSQLCGLCGDYNGIPSDDFRTPEGQVVKGVNDFGNSWNVDQNCTLTDTEVTPECSEAERDIYEGPSYCGMLLDHLGPFAACHYKIDPMAFFQDCVYDMCALNGNKQQLCEALESYVTQCQQRNVTIGTWRNETFCPLRCPPNSHYQPCASACPATCLEPRPQLCDQPCAEGCQCDKGFVHSGDKCVPRNQCGCMYNGTYYQPGDVIWSEACNQVCKCLSSNNVQCTDTSCGPDEYCDNKGGVQGCYPKGSSTCTASGDPHYTSFDKRKFNFQGNCTYVLAKPCNSSLTPFTVYTTNEHRNGVKTVSYVKAVYVSVYGITVSILRNRAVQVDGEPVTIPIRPLSGVTIKPSGKHVVLQTDFGVTVRYDGRHHVDVKVPSDYSGQLCGLCGDYNGIPSDDFRTPEGQVVKGVNDFGNSWNVDQNCTSTDTEVTPQCSEDDLQMYEGPSYCGILSDRFGPFTACHYKIDPMAFFRDCVYDMCALNGNKQQLCEAIEAYVTQCQQHNVTIQPWRNETFCPLQCPPNSHYQPCASACPATCLESHPQLCDQPCAEGCQCDKGFVQSGDKCVPRNQCGCVYNGTYYQPGDVIWSEACNQVCKCLSSNNVQCTDTSCGPDEYCDNKGGVQGCYPKDSSTCTASGDPHYTSFDKRKFNFQGNCTYVLAKPCNSSLTPFTVYTANEHRNGVKTVSYVKAVYVSVYGITVSILRNRAVQVDGEPVTVPIRPLPGVTISASGRHVVLQTDFGLTVRYDGRHHVDVKVSSDYSGQLCGLCGDYNGIPSDDFRTPEGQVVKGVNDFGNSWNVDQNCTSTDTEVTPQCSETEREKYEGPSYCGILLDRFGPFAACHYKIDPMAFFKDCVYDLCAMNGNKQQLCEAIEAYVTQCQQHNITIQPWRTETFCPLQCPPNSHYQPCASACPATCLEPRPQLCDQPCAEGCQCDKGFLQSGDKCVPRNQCGCVYNGTYYQPGDVIWSEACNQVCKCLSSNNVQCTDTSCGPDEYCDNKGGVQGCYPKGSSTCTASGDPHYTSFDKRKFNFQGNCTYVLAKPCNSSLTPFTVYTANEHRNGVKTVSYVKAVYVSVYGITVSILRNRAVQVDGEPVTVPIRPLPGVTVTPSGRHVVLQTDFGLTVRYDGRHHVDVKVLSDYSGQLCGLCGDYNGIPSDDFRTPEGQVVKGVSDFGNSWNVDQNCTLTDTDVIPQCSEADLEKYKGPSYCGILLDHFGPFVACHYKIDPMAFFKDCVYDLCAMNGNKQQLCEAIEAYVTQCQQHNVTIQPWRNETFCPLQCPSNSHYQPCASACPATCLEPRPQLCDQPCAEGCQCDKGFVQSGDKCVLRNQCGCMYNGTYYQPGDVIWSEACNQVCKCLSSNNIQCMDTSCGPDEYCDNKGGVQGCYPKDSSTCTASGDPHYTSFDKRKFNFQGNCTYILAKPCNSSLTPFTVYTANEHRNGVKTVSYVKAVHVSVYGITVSVLRNKIVQVDGKTVTVPHHPDIRLSVKLSGKHIIIETDFGLTVRYDGRHHAEVKVLRSYAGQLCGLCGDYNGIPSDDFRTPEGQIVKRVNDFGNSWNVDKNCSNTEIEVTPDCTEDEEEIYKGPTYCALLLDSHGPFAACHYKIDPMAVFRDCVYDMCAMDGNKQQLCEALEAYVNQCQQRNISIQPWRNESFCPLHCPVNSYYETCGSACPASCLDLQPPTCNAPCLEGCQCKKGFVQSGSQCVPEDQCGCSYNGIYYQPGADFFGPDCSLKCKCHGNNSTTCEAWKCGEKEFCGISNGHYGCHPTGSGICHISGDPHYITFDGKSLSFMGTCTYTLARSCENRTGPWFSIEGKNEERGQKGVSYLRKIYLTTNGITITLMKSRRTLVNGRRVHLPFQSSHGFTISLSGQYVVVETNFRLTLSWDGNHYLKIIVPTSYFNMMCGLCGNFDGNPNNDNIKPNGLEAGNVTELGNSWQTPDDEEESCKPHVPDELPCNKEVYDKVISSDMCGRINDVKGAFRDCIKVVDPKQYFNNCVYDMCQYQGLEKTLCDQLQVYTDACLSAGAPVHNWRTPDFCPLHCPENSHYSLCTSTCPPTCNDLFSPIHCSNQCVEGCECDEGFVLSNSECVRASECGCTDVTGDYRLPNETWYKKGCSEQCQCLGEKIIKCKPAGCTAGESCGLQDGEYGCHPLGHETCSASGDPHYMTFDKMVHHFMGTCTYTLSKLCNASSGLPYFNIETSNEHRGRNKQVSYVKEVHVEVHGHRITLMKNRRVIVDGRRVNPPVFMDNLQIRISGGYVLLETVFGLWVRYDGNHHVDVTVPSSYTGQLCGLCGNYNGKKTDDNLKPDGSVAETTDKLGESWLVPDNTTGCTNTGGIKGCDKDIEQEAQQSTSCGMIKDPTGPFKECHNKVPPEIYFESCVYDQCASEGDTGILCLALQSYAALCAQAGVPVTWRKKTFCPLNCPAGSHYEPCSSACPASCTDLSSANDCAHPCVEGCVCDRGYVLSGEKCVTFDQCGCVDSERNYHLLGENWITNRNCTERCTCSSPGNITCEQWECGPLDSCGVLDGVLGCQTTGSASCHVAGDPHYYTFDNAMHSFMGTCTYTLVSVCDTTKVTSFTISAKNEERGLPQVSYLREIHIDIYGHRISLKKSRRILVDGMRVRAPLFGQIKGISITSSGIYSLVETDFGLVVKFDGNHHLEIKVPSTYFGKVCGMCGNYNHNVTDELLMPDGKLANNVTHFGNSWKAAGDDDPGCQPDNRDKLTASCLPHFLPKVEAFCRELLTDKYRGCHHLTDPKPFVLNCVYDMCEYDGMISSLCDNIHSYIEVCKSEGIDIKWRNSTFCPLACPPNSHYVECATPCPATCVDIYAPSKCETPAACVEGCECDRGFVQSDNACVNLTNCGCLDTSNNYHTVGDSWLTADCKSKCTCVESGVYLCEEFKCQQETICAVDDGIRHCKPEKYNSCHIAGDPHYRTFDGFRHHYQGRYTYTLSKTIGSDNLEPFNISGKNKRRNFHSHVSFLEAVYVDVYGHSVTLMKYRQLAVDGIKIIPPYAPKEGLRIYQRSSTIYLETDFGLTVNFDGHSSAVITIPSTYKNHVRGLCGNYDGRRNNEFMKPDGTVVRNVNAFGNSWRVKPERRHSVESRAPERQKRELVDLDSGFTTGNCSSHQLSTMNNTNHCGALSNPEGPFKDCHSTVDPTNYQQDCLFDLCAFYNNTELLCANFEAYSLICQEQGVRLTNWRQQTGCSMKCPPNSTYKPCMTACPSTCADLSAPSKCSLTCLEGCECDRGFVLSGSECVPFNECGCTFHNKYYKLQEHFLLGDCQQDCVCGNTQTVQCEPTQCVTDQVCTVYNFTLGCFTDGPCLAYPCQNEGTCVPLGKNYTCKCEPGFTGRNCETEQTEITVPPDSDIQVILIAVLVPLAVLLIIVIGLGVYCCSYRKQRKPYKNNLKSRGNDGTMAVCVTEF
ncbi:IgGFc-binding protein-like isoform X2 [Hemitrygon akajei]|uniref:IgGFc-binding protein-like isoform X2 n=1 Tax=Hemitrygon akajei TaxID=2704970 RepID=UPI003BF9D6B2